MALTNQATTQSCTTIGDFWSSRSHVQCASTPDQRVTDEPTFAQTIGGTRQGNWGPSSTKLVTQLILMDILDAVI